MEDIIIDGGPLGSPDTTNGVGVYCVASIRRERGGERELKRVLGSIV